jgi:hypothetical protein
VPLNADEQIRALVEATADANERLGRLPEKSARFFGQKLRVRKFARGVNGA